MTTQPVATNATGIATYQAFFPGTSQKLTTGGASAQSSAFKSSTSLIKIFATQDCFIAIGDNPVAVGTGAGLSSCFVPGGIESYVGVGGGNKIAVIQSSTGGFLFVTEGL